MTTTAEFIKNAWKGETLEAMKNFIRIPSKSSAFEADWEVRGELLRAVRQAESWGHQRFPEGIFDVLQKPCVPPALYIDLPAFGGHTGRPVFFYGHFDKQPETQGWSEGLGPWTPVVKDGRLYGRGSSDDGYSFYTALTAIQALEASERPHPRIVGLFETDEESGSIDLAQYLKDIAPRAGNPCILAILDLGIHDYDRVWLTQSLRGVVSFKLKVEVLQHPVHSGIASGIVPSSFAVMRELLDRLEDPTTGRVKLPSFHVELPEEHRETLKRCAEIVGQHAVEFPYAGDTEPRSSDPFEAMKRNTWEPSLSILGADGLPSTSEASALLRASTTLALSFRLPPRLDAQRALNEAISAVTTNIPSHAKVTVYDLRAEGGFDAPALAPWLKNSIDKASTEAFGHPVEFCFEGASIGTMRDFRTTFPNASFFNTGVLGAKENAHAPDESLPLSYVERLTEVIARVVASVPLEEA